jgi:hypothetical protein
MWMLISFSAVLAFSTPAEVQQSCVASAPQVVDDIYKQVLERPADPASAELTQALASGRMTVRDVVAAVAKSPEYEARFFWPPIVAAIYRHVMQRSATDTEMRTAAAELARGGITPSALVAHIATRAVNRNPDAIRILYRRLLGREPDPDGLRTYTELAKRDGVEAVTQSIVASPEYRARATAAGIPLQGTDAYEQSVRGLYRRVLGREADAEGLHLLAELASVYGVRGPVDRMINSPEYAERYGENGIPGLRDVKFCGLPFGRRTALPRR